MRQPRHAGIRAGLRHGLLAAAALAAAGCEVRVEDDAPVETADEFVARINDELAEQNRLTGAANWVRATYIMHDTAILASAMAERYAEWHSRSVAASLAYAQQELAPATARALKLLKLETSEPAPSDPAKRRELAALTEELAGMYGAGKFCDDDGCRGLTELEDVFVESRDYDEQLAAWSGWRTVSVPMRDKYTRFVELVNEGAAELGYSDLGEMDRKSVV